MESNTVVVAVLAIVFFVLALVAIFRFDKVKNTFEGLGFKINVAGSRENKDNKTKKDSPKSTNRSATKGKSKVSVGGNIDDSQVLSDGADESLVDVKGDVKGSTIRSEAGKRSKR